VRHNLQSKHDLTTSVNKRPFDTGWHVRKSVDTSHRDIPGNRKLSVIHSLLRANAGLKLRSLLDVGLK